LTGLMEEWDLSVRPEGVTEILSINSTEPEEEVLAVEAGDEGCLEAPGLTVLQLVRKRNRAKMNMDINIVVLNIFSTWRILAQDKYSK
jgi:hypothetical protein